MEQWFGSLARENAVHLLAWTLSQPKSPRVDQLATELFARRTNGHSQTINDGRRAAPRRRGSARSGGQTLLSASWDRDHLHATRGTSWYRTPIEIVERNVHPVTGKLLADDDARGVREKFVANNIAPQERAEDYDRDGRVRLPVEYDDWLASAESAIGAAVTAAQFELRITSPLAGANYLLDPDVPTSGRIPLSASGGAKLVWQSDSLKCAQQDGSDYAIAIEGEHHITVTDAATGRHADIQISVRSL